ncbi:hypothetical protein FPV67DRAFT_1707708, partial [Lyophyllum atratum]
FHSVHLDTRHCERNERLHLTLLGNPVLASFTRSLTIYVAEKSRGSPLKAVCGILHMVQSHVRKLSVDGDFDHGTEPWKSFHESLQTALLSIIAHPSCVDVDIGYVGLPMTNLSESSHLRHLTLASRESVTIPGDILGEGFSHPGHGEPKIQGYLESLLVKSRGAAERILQTLHNPRHPCPLSLSHLKAILDLAADYLQEMMIYTLFDISSCPDFARLTDLRKLHVIFDYTTDMPLGACVIRIIETVPCGIRELVFQIHRRHLLVVKEHEWRQIDALLAHERHAPLRHVTFYGFRCEEGYLVDFFNDNMPRLAEKGVLTTHPQRPPKPGKASYASDGIGTRKTAITEPLLGVGINSVGGFEFDAGLVRAKATIFGRDISEMGGRRATEKKYGPRFWSLI